MERVHRVGAVNKGRTIGIEDINFFHVFHGRHGASHLIVPSRNRRVVESYFNIVGAECYGDVDERPVFIQCRRNTKQIGMGRFQCGPGKAKKQLVAVFILESSDHQLAIGVVGVPSERRVNTVDCCLATCRGKRKDQSGPTLVVPNIEITLGSTCVADVLSVDAKWCEEWVLVAELDALGLLVLDDVVTSEGAVFGRNDDQVGIGACDDACHLGS